MEIVCEYFASMTTIKVVIMMFCTFIVLGAIHNIVKIYRMKNMIKSIYEFCEQVAIMMENFNGDCSDQFINVLKTYSDVSDYLNESTYNNPALSLATSLKYNNLTLQELQNHYSNLCGNAISREEYLKKEIGKYKCYFFNPFVLFYEGVEAMLLYTVGYIIKMLYHDFNDEQKGWKIFVAIISICGSIASIVSLFK